MQEAYESLYANLQLELGSPKGELVNSKLEEDMISFNKWESIGENVPWDIIVRYKLSMLEVLRKFSIYRLIKDYNLKNSLD